MTVPLSLIERLLHRLHLLPTPIFDAFGAVLFGHALALSVRSGLFEVLDTGPLSNDDIAHTLGWDPRATRLMTESLVSMGYLSRQGRRYKCSAEGKKWCTRNSPMYLGNLIRYFETLYPRWDHLEYSLEHGGPEQPYYATFSDHEWEEYVVAMRDLARLLMPEVLPHLDLGASPLRLLDLGGSHGLYSMECCRRHPTLTATVMDFAPALRVTSSLVHAEQMGPRIRLAEGDILTADLPTEQDVILLFNIIHGFRPDTNHALIKRALRSLKRGGTLYILDQICDQPGRTSLAQSVSLMVGLNLMNEIGGYAYATEDVRSWAGGEEHCRAIRLRSPGLVLFRIW